MAQARTPARQVLLRTRRYYPSPATYNLHLRSGVMSSQQGSPALPRSGDPAQDRSGSAEAGSSRGDSSAPAAAAAAPASAPGQAPAAAGGQPGRSQPESPAAAGQGTLTRWTVDKRSDRALNTFLASNRPRVSHQDRPRQVRRVVTTKARAERLKQEQPEERVGR